MVQVLELLSKDAESIYNIGNRQWGFCQVYPTNMPASGLQSIVALTSLTQLTIFGYVVRCEGCYFCTHLWFLFGLAANHRDRICGHI